MSSHDCQLEYEINYKVISKVNIHEDSYYESLKVCSQCSNYEHIVKCMNNEVSMRLNLFINNLNLSDRITVKLSSNPKPASIISASRTKLIGYVSRPTANILACRIVDAKQHKNNVAVIDRYIDALDDYKINVQNLNNLRHIRNSYPTYRELKRIKSKIANYENLLKVSQQWLINEELVKQGKKPKFYCNLAKLDIETKDHKRKLQIVLSDSETIPKIIRNLTDIKILLERDLDRDEHFANMCDEITVFETVVKQFVKVRNNTKKFLMQFSVDETKTFYVWEHKNKRYSYRIFAQQLTPLRSNV